MDFAFSRRFSVSAAKPTTRAGLVVRCGGAAGADQPLEFQHPVFLHAVPDVGGEEEVFAVRIKLHFQVLVGRRDGRVVVEPGFDFFAA